jgi:cytoskeleton protein RodZ
MALQPTQMSEASAANRRAHLKEVTSEPDPDSLGAELRATRLKLGEDLKGASKVTKIKPEYLEALEEGRLDALPGRTYVIGFLRTYADYLKLDSAAFVARLKSEYPADKPAEAAAKLGLPEIEEEMRIPQGALIIVGIILIGAIYAGVYLFRSANEYMEQRAHPGAPVSTPPIGPASDAAHTPAPATAAPADSAANATPAASSASAAPAPTVSEPAPAPVHEA